MNTLITIVALGLGFVIGLLIIIVTRISDIYRLLKEDAEPNP